MASAMMIGQLTGKMPTERQIVFEAMRTPSDVLPGQMMYWGLKNQWRWAYYKDAQKLLTHHGVDSTLTEYSNQPDIALENLKTALSDPDKATMVAIHAQTVWNAVVYNKGFAPPPPGTRANHAIVVIGVDTATNTVYVNDSSVSQINPATGRPWGQSMAVPLDVFMAAWQTGAYLTVVGEYSLEPTPPTTWLSISPRRDTVRSCKGRASVPLPQPLTRHRTTGRAVCDEQRSGGYRNGDRSTYRQDAARRPDRLRGDAHAERYQARQDDVPRPQEQ